MGSFTLVGDVWMLEVRENSGRELWAELRCYSPTEVPVSSQSSYWSSRLAPLMPLKVQSTRVYLLNRTMAPTGWPLGLYTLNPAGAGADSDRWPQTGASLSDHVLCFYNPIRNSDLGLGEYLERCKVSCGFLLMEVTHCPFQADESHKKLSPRIITRGVVRQKHPHVPWSHDHPILRRQISA